MKSRRFRLGTTSYILPDELLPNVRYLADKIDDVELLLFELDDRHSNLPASDALEDLVELARAHDLTYTVHLPLDLRLGSRGSSWRSSVERASRVVGRMSRLRPHAYVLHVEKEPELDPPIRIDQACRALEILSQPAGDAARLAVENLEGEPFDALGAIFERLPVSRCLDIGHLWVDGLDPLDCLPDVLERTRVIHLHGVGERDHRSLSHVPVAQLEAVVRGLLAAAYDGVLTLEVFNELDLSTSLDALRAAWTAARSALSHDASR